jgi:DNA-binding HxlR family transcriptional regulator
VRSYRQYCAVAKALDVIGDRWSLLIVRELLLRGPCRYTDLQYGLPGIATNLLAERLRDLEGAGIIEREAAPPPIATTLFHLSERGRELSPVLHALGHWGTDLMVETSDDEAFRSHWLAFAAEDFLSDHDPDRPPITIAVRTGDQAMLLETVAGSVRARPGTTDDPDAVITGPPRLILGLLSGRIDLREARARGLRFQGASSALRRVAGAPGCE